MIRFATAEWMRAWLDLANETSEHVGGDDWRAPLGLIIEPDATVGVPRRVVCRIHRRGGRFEGSLGSEDEAVADADLVVGGPASVWSSVMAGQLTLAQAVLRGELTVRGSPDREADSIESMTRLLALATKVRAALPQVAGEAAEPVAEESRPSTRYVNSGGAMIAYSMWGEGPLDLVLVPGFTSHLEHQWLEPSLARFLRRLGSFARVVTFDKRGMGLSDRHLDCEDVSMADRLADLRAVTQAACPRPIVLFAFSDGGPLGLLYAAAYPDDVAALILAATSPRGTADEDFPAGVPREVMYAFIDSWQEGWGTGIGLELFAPSLADDPRTRSWWASFQRHAATPGAVAAALRADVDIDVRDVLAEIRVPTLIIHAVGDLVVPVACARYMAERIPGARLVELPGADHSYWAGDQDRILEVIRSFLAQTSHGQALRRSRRRRPATGWESLTEAELDVVRLMCDGLTNPQVAQRLRISPRTVQAHVAHVLGKLGASRRSEVVAQATRHLA